MTKIEGMVMLSLLFNGLLFIGFLYLKNTLKNAISVINGILKRMGIEVNVVRGNAVVKELPKK